ncbi:Schwannomin-interacting protein 1, partial [Dissostichus eleginoides]
LNRTAGVPKPWHHYSPFFSEHTQHHSRGGISHSQQFHTPNNHHRTKLQAATESHGYSESLCQPRSSSMLLDYREDGMDLGSDASSRSSSESNSNKVTPCSPSLDLTTLEDYKSSPSLDLVTLEDYEEDEDYQEYKKKVIEEWESEYGEGYTSPKPPGQEEVGGGVVGEDILGEGYRKTVNSRSLAEELEDVKTVPPPPASGGHTATSVAAVPEELKQNGNLILPRSHQLSSPGTPRSGTGTPKPRHRSSSKGRGSRSTAGGGGSGGGSSGGTGGRMGGYKEDEVLEEEPLPTMDWAALERHLAGLQCREQENQNLNHNQNHIMGKTNYTSVYMYTLGNGATVP